MSRTEQRTSLYVEEDGSAVLTVGEDVHVDIDETAFRVVREEGEIRVVEVGNPDERVIASQVVA